MPDPPGHPVSRPPPPRIIAWEVTRSCPLACRHCRAAARRGPYPDEFSTPECLRVIEGLAPWARPLLILTGGEPLLRPDIYDLAAAARGAGMPVVLATCGMLVDETAARRMKEAGIRRISVSLDGASPASHDEFRGVRGAFDGALRGIEAARRAGLQFQVNTTVTRANAADLPAILDLAVRLGAACFNAFLLVPTGRGRDLADQELAPEAYERTLRWLADQDARADIQVRVTCAPHYQRILRERRQARDAAPAASLLVGEGGGEGDTPSPLVGEGGGEGAAAGRQRPPRGRLSGPEAHGCLGGKSFAFISHIGKVQMCGFLDLEGGDLRRQDYDFRRIWETSDLLRRARDVDHYGGRCGYCEYRRVCGGCRARAFATSGDFLAEEPFCVYQPRRRPPGTGPARPLDALDRRILAAIQADLPVSERPFDDLAARLGAAPEEVLGHVGRFVQEGLVRRLGPVFDSRALGYASTLVAARVPAERLHAVADQVSACPGVTHNYERRPAEKEPRDRTVPNLWFTLTAPSQRELDEALADLGRRTGAALHALPALAVYKIRVAFDVGEAAKAPPAQSPGAGHVGGAQGPMDEPQRQLVRALQDGLPVEREPFATVAARVGRPVEEVLRQVREWLAAGVVRRFGAVVRHRDLGYRANGMAVFRLGPEQVDEAGRRLAARPEITHCYRRPALPDFPYELYAMIHGRTEKEVRDLAARLAAEIGAPDHAVLSSVHEFKKSSMRYFV